MKKEMEAVRGQVRLTNRGPSRSGDGMGINALWGPLQFPGTVIQLQLHSPFPSLFWPGLQQQNSGNRGGTGLGGPSF